MEKNGALRFGLSQFEALQKEPNALTIEQILRVAEKLGLVWEVGDDICVHLSRLYKHHQAQVLAIFDAERDGAATEIINSMMRRKTETNNRIIELTNLAAALNIELHAANRGSG